MAASRTTAATPWARASPTRIATTPWGQAIGGPGSAYNPFGYTATYKDAATGLYQMGARYYQPASGRFTQLDALPSKLLTVNRYYYTDCNPTNYTDPTGLDSGTCAGAAVAAYAGLAALAVIASMVSLGLGGLVLAAGSAYLAFLLRQIIGLADDYSCDELAAHVDVTPW